jgi:WD40 repeat protein/serine/threonine protein kinase
LVDYPMDTEVMAARIQCALGDSSEVSVSPSPRLPPAVPGLEFLTTIGAGSYGEVWLVRTVTGSFRALKVIWRSRFSSDRPYEREFRGITQFERISRAHLGVVDVLHVGRDDRAGCFFYDMELADPADRKTRFPDDHPPRSVDASTYAPRTLASELKTRARLPLTEVLMLGVRLADALGHLHRHGLVHRDVKPSNVIFVDGLPKLADIGLIAGADEARSFVGTEGFIPPEGPGTVQADIFGLGRLLYEAATGKDRCEFPDLPVDLSGWPDREGLLELNEVLARACAPHPKDRHANTAELAGDLNVLLSGRSIRGVYGTERRLRHATRAMAVAVLIVTFAVAGIWLQRSQRREADDRAERETALRKRAEEAESMGREQLRSALLRQAWASTSGNEPDRRAQALVALREAAAIRPGLDLRNAALAALATPQLQLVRRWNHRGEGSVNEYPDSLLERYARCNADGTVTVYSCASDAEVARLPGVGTRAEHAVFSPDGVHLAVQYVSGDLRIWHLATLANRLLAGRVTDFAFCPKDDRLLAADAAGQLSCFEVNSGSLIYREPLGYVADRVSCHPIDPLVATPANGRTTIDFRNSVNGRVVRSLVMPPVGMSAVWSADGRFLLTAHADHSVRVWDWPLAETPRHILRFHRAQPVGLRTDPTGQWLATTGWDNQSALFDLRDGRRVLSFSGQIISAALDRPAFLLADGESWRLLNLEAAFAFQAYQLHETHLSPRNLAFSPNGRWLASCGQDGVRLFEWAVPKVHRLVVNDMAHRVAFSEDSKLLYALTPSRIVAWSIDADPQTGELHTRHSSLPQDGQRGFNDVDVRETGLALDGRQWIAAATHPQTGRRSWVVGRFDALETTFLSPLTELAGQPDLSPDGQWVAWGGWKVDDASVAATESDQPPIRFPIEGSASVKFSPDGRRLVIGGYRHIQVRETGTWRVMHVIPRHLPGPLPPGFAFTSDSRMCAAGLAPDRLLLFDVETGLELATLPANHHMLQQPAFSPDNQLLAATSVDHHVLLWNLPELRGKLEELGLNW